MARAILKMKVIIFSISSPKVSASKGFVMVMVTAKTDSGKTKPKKDKMVIFFI